MGQVFPDADAERMELGRLLARAGQVVQGHHRSAAAEHGLTPTSIGVLELLAHPRTVEGGCSSHRELAGALGVAPATLTSVVDTLQAAGAVTRSREVTDRRVVRVTITATGRERLAASRRAVAGALRQRVPRPPPEHEEAIRRYLISVLAASDAGGPSAQACGGPAPVGADAVEPRRERPYPAVELHRHGHLGGGRVRVGDPDPGEPGA